jgi:large subunit ribosomal protein L13
LGLTSPFLCHRTLTPLPEPLWFRWRQLVRGEYLPKRSRQRYQEKVASAMKTYSAKPSEVEAKWWIIDAEGIVLGRMASIIAMRLRGKHKPMYTPNIDCGDHVVVINADKVRLTGKKREDKIYYWHTGYPGGIKARTADKYLDSPQSDVVVRKAVERMLPKTKMGREQYRKLKVYAGTEHPHEAQQPQALDVASMNDKNKRGGAA